MGNRKKILVVDDEADICEILKFNLDKAGFDTHTANSAEEALTSGVAGYDLILLDIMMDGISGLKMAEMMKKNPDTAGIPIIFVTAKDTEDDTVNGLGAGADDYISKPFSIRELISRVMAVLRRYSASSSAPQETIGYNGLQMDLGRKTVSVNGRQVDLTRTEFEILHLLMSHPSHVFSRDDILAKAWPDEVVVLGRTVDVNITRMRKKLGEYGDCITTRHGYGYCFEKP